MVDQASRDSCAIPLAPTKTEEWVRGGLSIQVMRPMTMLETKAREGARKVAKKMLNRVMLSGTKKGGLL